MLNYPYILLILSCILLVVAFCMSIIEGIWDSVENDVAKQEGYDKIKK